MSLYKTIKKNYSFLRFFQHEIIKDVKLHGNVIDLGSKSENERYFEHLNLDNVDNLDFCDIYSESKNVKVLNLEEKFRIDSNFYDSVVYFNVLEHIYNYSNLISETHRILKMNCFCHVIIPFMWHYHGDPDDFNRFTHTALYRKFTEVGFRSVEVYPIGCGIWTVIGNLLYKRIPSRLLKYLTLRTFMTLQIIEDNIIGVKNEYCLAYYLKAKK